MDSGVQMQQTPAQQNPGPVFSRLTYFKISGRLPTQAGLTYEEALAFEAAEYRKAYNKELMKDYEPTEETINKHARELGRMFDIVSQLYGERP